jgi:uncharacterized protein (DUF1501 family)
MSHSKIARRAFLQRMGHLGIAGTAAPWAINLAAMGEAAAFTGGGYKALVCIFLYGGNDHGNTVVPYDSSSYSSYASARGTVLTTAGGIVLPRASLDATALSAAGLPAGRQYALAPGLAPLKALYEKGQLAVQMNVGPLIRPTTLEQYRNKSVPLPPKLFSHNDQQSVWQSSYAEGSVKGWGGNIGDLALSSNGANSMFTCVSVTGNAVFLSGDSALSYQMGAGGAVAINPVVNAAYGSAACQAALRTLITQPRGNVLENELNRIAARSIDSQAVLSGAVAGSAGKFDALLPDQVDGKNISINRQLKMVARLIDAQASLGLTRQVFMVSMGGFDTHDNLATTHASLMTQLGSAMAGFQTAMDQIGKSNMVTAFTASDFGRTITSNGDGSDHAWGAHHFVMGGAVKGKAFYGTAPSAIAGGIEDVGQGRYIPSTSVDQYAATLARWFGVADSELAQVAPSIGNFTTRNIGFV